MSVRSTHPCAHVAHVLLGAGALCLAQAAQPAPTRAQAIPREAYIKQLPAAPRIVSQAPASAALHLYGDADSPGYVDRAPVDGIDDRRAERLLALAERFSPILRRNSFVAPRDIWWVVGDRPRLTIDRWSNYDLVDSTSLIFEARPGAASAASISAAPTESDARLAALVQEYDPARREPVVLAPGARTTKILFFDTPGEGEASWRAAYTPRGHGGSKIHAHFFVHEDTLAVDDRRYMLAVQYWFFYPFNDSGNNHEGDWEHINVLLTTRASIVDTTRPQARAGFVHASDIGAILGDAIPLEQLAIAKVDYFFHHNVLTLDYRAAHLPHGKRHRRAPVTDSVSAMWDDHGYMRDVIHLRLEVHDGALATHPIGFIGGNNKGPDELAHVIPRFGRSYNRTSGATYPFPGTWQTIGPLGATETVWGTIVPDVARRASPDSGAPPIVEVQGDDYLTYTRSSIVLLPDWERVLPLVRSDAMVRREWAWLALPIRWGYPATRSPGAGVIAHADLGNLAPFGPAFKLAWNAVGADRDHLDYQFRALRTPMSPHVAWSILQSGWGVLNVPLVLTQIYPFYNMAGAHLSPLSLRLAGGIGVKFPKTFVATPLDRTASIGVGASHQFGGDAYARAMVPLAERSDARFAALRAEEHRLGDERVSISRATGPRFLLDLHMGRKLFLENTFTMGNADVRYTTADRTTGDDVTLDGTVHLRQITGGLRKVLPWTHSTNQNLYGRLGTGWAWYTLRDVQLDGAPLGEETTGGYAPAILPGRRSWPNFAYTGVAWEYFTPRSKWIGKRVGYGMRVDANWILQRLPSHEIAARHDLWVGRGDFGLTATIGW